MSNSIMLKKFILEQDSIPTDLIARFRKYSNNAAFFLISLSSLIFMLSPSTFSQTTSEPTEQAAVAAPMVLPAENVELTDTQGRTITVTVLSRDDKGITIRTADGTDHDVAWSKLNADTRTKILGEAASEVAQKVTPPAPKSYEHPLLIETKAIFQKNADSVPKNATEARIKEIMEVMAPYSIYQANKLVAADYQTQRHVWAKIGEKLPAEEARRRILDTTDLEIDVLLNFRNKSLSKKVSGLHKDPDWEKYNLYPLDILKDLEIKPSDEEETVSLRPRFEELGIKATKQVGEACALYGTYHMLQYATLDSNQPAPSLDSLKNNYLRVAKTINGRYQDRKLMEIIPTVTGRRPVIQWISGNDTSRMHIGQLRYEIAKHELRNGRPVLIEYGDHITLLTGFQSKDGELTWEYLDSNTVHRNGGYKSLQAGFLPIYSIRFE